MFQVMGIVFSMHLVWELLVILQTATPGSIMYRLLICQQIYDNFNIYKDQILMCHENIATSQQYQNSMVFGSEYATSCEIGEACRIMNTNINIWLQGRNDKNVICFTKEEYIHSP